MPVILNSKMFDSSRGPRGNERSDTPDANHDEPARKELSIGLINNVPDSALLATERQFISLLNSASNGMSVRLSLYSLRGVPRSDASARRISRFYSSAECLRGVELDGLIVTGRESVTPDLADEPYWESFTGIVEWARSHTYSTIWSCLAAHAAVQYMEGIRRVRNGRKHCGLFECRRISDHPITEGTPSHFRVPHSRWNSVREEDLAQRGYHVLTQTETASVDIFLKQEQSLFVFFQGHPEYERTTLLLEYRRDVGRYLRAESNTYPAIPQGYLDRDTTLALTALEERARAHRSEALIAQVNAILEKASIEQSWRLAAVQIYRNWLKYICAEKERSERYDHLAVDKIDSLIPNTAGSELPGRPNLLTR
ncbi:MAG: homoserine O-succinyltransferase [Terracidiphilus sp.]